VHIHRPTYVGQLYAYAYFESAYACRKHAHANALKNPNLESQKARTQNRVET